MKTFLTKYRIISIALTVLLFFSYVIPDIIKYPLLLIILLTELLRFLAIKKGYKIKPKFQKVLKIIFVLLLVVISGLELRFRWFIGNINHAQEEVQFEMVGLNDFNISELNELNGYSIGLLNDKNSNIGYKAPQSFFEEKSLDLDYKLYEDYIEMIDALVNQEVDLIVLPYGYKETLAEYSEIANKLDLVHTVYSASIKQDVEIISNNSDVLNLVLIGGDNPIVGKSTSGFNYDVIVVYSINFKTHESVMLSIPRDSYIYSSCSQRLDKITHTGWYGANCLTDTLTDFLGIEMSQYILIDFKGLINVVDSIGGVWIDVEQAIDEQDENRDFTNMIHIDPGYQLLDGQQALAFLRHRHTLSTGAIGRSENHEKFLIALLQQMAKPSSLLKINSLFSALEESALTNISSQDFSKYYEKSLSMLASVGVDGIVPEQVSLSGHGDLIWTPSFGMNLYYFVLDQESVDAVQTAFQNVQE